MTHNYFSSVFHVVVLFAPFSFHFSSLYAFHPVVDAFSFLSTEVNIVSGKSHTERGFEGEEKEEKK